MEALQFLKEQKRRHQNMANSMRVVYFDDKLDEAIEELDKFITNYQGLKRRLNKSIDALNILSKDCKQCKHHLSDNGNFPLSCMECSLFYGNKWESKCN
jgi:hypothetical protein